MITFEKALRLIDTQPASCTAERIAFTDATGRVLAEDVCSDMDMPPFDKSAMDGYACRREDLPGPFVVVEEIPAGRMPEKRVMPGTCSRIMTGAPLPDGANCVMMAEDTGLDASGRVFFSKGDTKPNICYQGEDVRKGDVLIEKGTLILPQHIAIMASAGATEVLVSRQPRIGVHSTGNELVEPDILPEGSMIRNSNGYQVVAQLQQSHFDAAYLGIIPDTPEDTASAIMKGLAVCDILVLTGGVSQGEYDFVPQVMEQCGVEILFHQLAVQPGKPSLFGKRDDGKYLFGLPGNPVSSFIQTELLVKRLCYRLQGHTFSAPLIMMPLGVDYRRKRAGRKSFVPVMIEGGKVFPVDYHGSAHIQALHKAHGIISLDPGTEYIQQGEMVHVRLF